MTTASTRLGHLQPRTILVNGRRTSIRLEPSIWFALEEISRRENRSIGQLCSLLDESLRGQRDASFPEKQASLTLASAVRVFVASYYRIAATEEGHAAAGHGRASPLIGTPFEPILPGYSGGEHPRVAETRARPEFGAGASFGREGPWR